VPHSLTGLALRVAVVVILVGCTRPAAEPPPAADPATQQTRLDALAGLEKAGLIEGAATLPARPDAGTARLTVTRKFLARPAKEQGTVALLAYLYAFAVPDESADDGRGLLTLADSRTGAMLGTFDARRGLRLD
jgi:hypothetical protein